ncbi:MAG: hypothetical protein HZA22_13265 [Nitrospirae bacterium]|nr:hypothetical protein [Nitrospirota bacterium]MBI5694667.1 hypothetical protein [Nitrospirota bacterium]
MLNTRRTNYLINRRFQLRITLAFVGAALACLALSCAAILHEINEQIESYIATPSAEVSSTGDIILPVVFRVSAVFSVSMLAIIVVMSLLYFWHAKRIAGDLDENLDRFAEGDLNSRLLMRHSAAFQDTEDEFNLMLSLNSVRVSALQRAAADISRDILAVKSAVGEGRDAGAEVAALRARLNDIKDALAVYRLRQ